MDFRHLPRRIIHPDFTEHRNAFIISFMKKPNKLHLFSLFLATTLLLPQMAWAKFYKYTDLRMQDLDQMRTAVQEKIQSSRQLAKKGAQGEQEAVDELRGELQWLCNNAAELIPVLTSAQASSDSEAEVVQETAPQRPRRTGQQQLW